MFVLCNWIQTNFKKHKFFFFFFWYEEIEQWDECQLDEDNLFFEKKNIIEFQFMTFTPK